MSPEREAEINREVRALAWTLWIGVAFLLAGLAAGCLDEPPGAERAARAAERERREYEVRMGELERVEARTKELTDRWAKECYGLTVRERFECVKKIGWDVE